MIVLFSLILFLSSLISIRESQFIHLVDQFSVLDVDDCLRVWLEVCTVRRAVHTLELITYAQAINRSAMLLE